MQESEKIPAEGEDEKLEDLVIQLCVYMQSMNPMRKWFRVLKLIVTCWIAALIHPVKVSREVRRAQFADVVDDIPSGSVELISIQEFGKFVSEFAYELASPEKIKQILVPEIEFNRLEETCSDSPANPRETLFRLRNSLDLASMDDDAIVSLGLVGTATLALFSVVVFGNWVRLRSNDHPASIGGLNGGLLALVLLITICTSLVGQLCSGSISNYAIAHAKTLNKASTLTASIVTLQLGVGLTLSSSSKIAIIISFIIFFISLWSTLFSEHLLNIAEARMKAISR